MGNYGASIKVNCNENDEAVIEHVYLCEIESGDVKNPLTFDNLEQMFDYLCEKNEQENYITFYNLKLAGYQIKRFLEENKYKEADLSKAPTHKSRATNSKTYRYITFKQTDYGHITFRYKSSYFEFKSLCYFISSDYMAFANGFDVDFCLNQLDTEKEAEFIAKLLIKIDTVLDDLGVEKSDTVNSTSFNYLRKATPDFVKRFMISDPDRYKGQSMSEYWRKWRVARGDNKALLETIPINMYDFTPNRTYDNDPKPYDYVSLAITGGLNRVFKQKSIVENGVTLDINSHYLNQLHSKSGHKYPYGRHLYHEDPKEFEYISRDCLFVMRIKIYGQPKTKPGKFDFLNLIDFRTLNDKDDPKQHKIYTICSPWYWLLFENYESVDYEIIDFMSFKSSNGIGMFDTWIDTLYPIKQMSSGAERYLAKMLLNTGTGKFSQDTNGSYHFIEDEDGYFREEELKSKKEVRRYSCYYPPITAFIQCYSAIYLLQLCEKFADRICYCDTDSLHICNMSRDEAESIFTISSNLGDWKIEHTWDKAIFAERKVYIINDTDYGTVIKGAGLLQWQKDCLIDNFDFDTIAKISSDENSSLINTSSILNSQFDMDYDRYELKKCKHGFYR